MNTFLIEIQGVFEKNGNPPFFVYVARNARSGYVESIGHSVTELKAWLDCLEVSKD